VRRRIGIDVGGTNTDAVLLEEDAVAAAVKTPTTADVTTGITRALAALVERAPTARDAHAVMIGTTHFTNAVVQRRDLGRVAAVRIGLPSGASLPPFVVIAFELTILFGGIATLIGMVVLGRLPKFRPSPGFDPRFTRDRFGVAVHCAPDRGGSVREILGAAGAEEVKAV